MGEARKPYRVDDVAGGGCGPLAPWPVVRFVLVLRLGGRDVRIHHLNCVSACPLGGALMDGRTGASLRGKLVNHCLLVETGSSLVLVDTGYGTRDVAQPRARLHPFFLSMLQPELRMEATAIRQIERLGFDPRDVTDVVLTHLDFDHAGGLDDFPHARVHLLRAEERSATARTTPLDRMRYRPAQWSTRLQWCNYDPTAGDAWFGFDCVRPLPMCGEDLALVPLIGHTLGHAGVAVRRDRDWLLLAGDAYFFHAEMDPVRPTCTPGLALYQKLMEKDRRSRLHNQARLRELARVHGGSVVVISSHDLTEFERMIAGIPQPASTVPVSSRSSSPSKPLDEDFVGS